MLGALPTPAQDLPPLRNDIQNLKSLLEALSAEPSYPPTSTLGANSFRAIAPHVSGLPRLAQFGLVKVAEDAPTLSDFLLQTLTARLRELDIEGEVQAQPSAHLERGVDCNVLSLTVSFDARKIVLDGRPMVAVVANINFSQLVPEPEPSGTLSTCSADNRALFDAGLADVFLVEPAQREKTVALAKDALLSIVDHFVLYRLVLTNSTARERVRSWVRQ